MKGAASALMLWIGLAACQSATHQPRFEDSKRLEAGIRMPPGASPLVSYARYYLPTQTVSAETLPFTTISDHLPQRLDHPSELVLAIFIRPDIGLADAEQRWNRAPGSYLVETLPSVVHAGCGAVNVLIAPESGEMIAAWCNVDL
ncbi:MAG: hypothetical protein ACT6RD_11240 [Brevundimonas sp.]|uniref:hypothetical protein n=1 Tax=Brevundimonas sp. TaxID=1871086 RepID=UPI004033F2C2